MQVLSSPGRVLHLRHNSLTGSLPPEWGNSRRIPAAAAPGLVQQPSDEQPATRVGAETRSFPSLSKVFTCNNNSLTGQPAAGVGRIHFVFNKAEVSPVA